MTTVILLQSTESADWEVLPGSYDSFQRAREMVQFIRGSYGASASFAIENADDVSRKGYSIA